MRLCLSLAAAAVLAACTVNGGTQSAAAGTTAIPAPGSWSNPFAYCRAVGTIDQPDARYTGPQPPPAVVAGLERAFGVTPSPERDAAFARGAFWRCMDGEVYACNTGANLPCRSKANVSSKPTDAEQQYCEANHDALFIPMYVTGHDTLYEWRCKGTRPVTAKALGAVDKRGYLADIWYEIPPPHTPP